MKRDQHKRTTYSLALMPRARQVLHIWIKTNKRDLYIWKETYINEKRPTQENYILILILHIWIKTNKRDLYTWKVTSKTVLRTSFHTQNLHICKKTTHRDPYTWKETHINKKRPTKESYLLPHIRVWGGFD